MLSRATAIVLTAVDLCVSFAEIAVHAADLRCIAVADGGQPAPPARVDEPPSGADLALLSATGRRQGGVMLLCRPSPPVTSASACMFVAEFARASNW